MKPVEETSEREMGSDAPEGGPVVKLWAGRQQMGLVGWLILAGVAVLIAAEAVSVLGGLGPVFGVIALGYFMVLGVIYWLYRWAKATEGADGPTEATSQVKVPYVLQNRPMNVDIFEGLTRAQASEVMGLGQRMTVPSGESLVTQGDPGNTLYIVLSGQAQLSARSGVGEITVRVAGPGESFPLAAMTGSGNHITSAEALTDMEVVAIPTSVLRALFKRRPEIGMRMYEVMAEVLAERYRKTLARMTRGAEKALREADFFANV